MRRAASILDQLHMSWVAAADVADGRAWVSQAEAIVFHVVAGEDPLVDVNAAWSLRGQGPVVLLGDDIDDALRSAALEAGVAHVTRAHPTPEELAAMLRMAAEQAHVG